MVREQAREAIHAWAISAIALGSLRDVVGVLSPLGIDVMPLKGVVLQRIAYDDPADRRLVDVDLAVRSRDFHRAYAALVAAGFTDAHEEPHVWEVALRRPGSPLCVDLHQHFTDAPRFRLSPDVMFARGHRDEALFGVPVIMPDDHDLYAHVFAHFAVTYVIGNRLHHPDDLRRLAAARKLDVAVCAARLDDAGLARFARALLPLLIEGESDAFAGAVLAALKPDPIGDAIARAARAVFAHAPAQATSRRVAGLLLNPTLGDATRALAEAATRRVRELRG
jgi:hypothetical protein